MSETSTKERPILFSGSMVRAILNGTKTQTRRVVKGSSDCEGFTELERFPVIYRGWWSSGNANSSIDIDCPYGSVGDRLWVRETFCKLEPEHVIDGQHYAYKANCRDEDGERCRQEYIRAGYPYQWKPSIHMPRIASRITLEVTGIRVDRVQDISDSDIESEGLQFDFTGERKTKRKQSSIRRHYFAELWDSINKDRKRPGHDWNSNPWVWVVEFKRLESQA